MSEDAGSLSRILSGSTVILTGSIINKFVSFAGSVFIARLLGDTGYGVVVVALSVYFTLCNLLTLGLSGGIARNYPRAETEQDQRGVLVTAYRIGTIVGVLGGMGVLVGAYPIAIYIFNDRSIYLVLRALAVIIPLKVILNLANGSFQAVRKPSIKTAISSIIQPVIRIVFIVLLVMAGFEALGVAAAYAIATASAAILSLYYVNQYTDLFNLNKTANTSYRSLLSFSVPLVGSTILVDLMNNIDTLLIGSLATSADVGQYNVAFVLGQSTLLFLQTLGFMYIPEISRLHAENRIERASMVYRAITKWVLFISIPFILTAIAFPTYILTFIYSTEYSSASVPFLILIGGFLTHILNGPNHGTLTAFGDTRQLLMFDIATISLNLILNFSLIPKYGITGAALATASSYLLRNVIMTYYLNNTYGITPFSRWLFYPLLPMFGVAGLLRLIIPEPSVPLLVGYAAILVVTILLGYLSNGIEEADLILANLLEENLGLDLQYIRKAHDKLR